LLLSPLLLDRVSQVDTLAGPCFHFQPQPFRQDVIQHQYALAIEHPDVITHEQIRTDLLAKADGAVAVVVAVFGDGHRVDAQLACHGAGQALPFLQAQQGDGAQIIFHGVVFTVVQGHPGHGRNICQCFTENFVNLLVIM
jgi:hypothetical protein